MACFSVLSLILLSIYYNSSGCDAGSCTCPQTQSECEAAGELKYDEAGNIFRQCSWLSSHNACRRTEWVQCKDDPGCIWIHKTDDDDAINEETDETNPENPCTVNQQYKSDNFPPMQLQLQASNIRMYALYTFLIFAIGVAMYSLFGNKNKSKIISNDTLITQHRDYFTFTAL
eukprot:UN00190